MPLQTRKVLLMRHAKSSWSTPGLKDFDRPLNKRGERDAPRMGRYLQELQLIPDQIFSSPATRAKSTILKVINALELPSGTITWNKDLYFNGVEAYLNAIRRADENSKIMMTVGHNPMTEDVISKLSGNSSRKVIKTATIACLEFKTNSWKDIQYGAGELKWVISPKDLK